MRSKGEQTKKTRRRLTATDRHLKDAPLDVMIANMNWALRRANEHGEETPAHAEFRQIAQQAAKDAAPYVHPRLNAVEHSGEIKTNPVNDLLSSIDGATRGLPDEPQDGDSIH